MNKRQFEKEDETYKIEPCDVYTQNHVTYKQKESRKRLDIFEILNLFCCSTRVLYYTLISTSTPLGSSSFINASTVLAVEL